MPSRWNVQWSLIHYNELIVTGTTGNTTEDCRAALALVIGGRIDTAGLISARYSLAESAAAFVAAQSGQALKVILEPSGPTGLLSKDRTP